MCRRIPILAIALFATVGACQDPGFGFVSTLPATLEVSDADTIVFLVPDTVQQGVPFNVSVRAYGGGCVSKGPFDVLTPFDTLTTLNPYEIIRSGSGVACSQEFAIFTHAATLTFTQPGTVAVRVFGRDRAGIAIERTRFVEVQ